MKKNIKTFVGLLLISFFSNQLFAQELPPIFEQTPVKLDKSNIIASFPEKTFLENLIHLPDGDFLINSHYEGIVYKVKLDGTKTKFAAVEGKLAGIAQYKKDKFILSGYDKEDKSVLYLLDTKGTIAKIIDLPDALFLNGITALDNEEFLIADSYKGCIWKANIKTKEIVVWLEDSLLKRNDIQNPTPAANGLKIFKNTLFVSNTQNQQLLQIELKNNRPSKPVVYVSKVNIDDFAVDQTGIIYATTHVYNSIIKIDTNKKITIIADQTNGVAGSTSCVLSLDKKTKQSKLYVVTNGGMYYPPKSGIEQSKVIEIQLN